ncbi:MAG: glycine cleavage system aminomethyltransferase GcvT [Planktomarina sp.]|nr:glycine cleavage system aminomethyltransferase GcvT [Planktomarina sp.]
MTLKAKHTPLYDLHCELGGKMVDFAGWEMPVQYPMGIMGEHNICRTKAALFDVSHMGQVILRGHNVAQKLEALVPSALKELPVGKARYTLLTNADGGIKDDLIVSNAGDHLFLVVNASMRDKDIPYMTKVLDGIEVREIFDQALIALQGPAAERVLKTHCTAIVNLKFMESITAMINGVPCRISRLGYTGEDGFEISIPESKAEDITRSILDHPDCFPAGLGARDSLRMEAGLCLYGNDIDENTSPVEANLSWTIQKRRQLERNFPGATRILRELTDGPSQKLVGIKPLGRAPARAGVEVQNQNGQVIGTITSGGFGPTFDGPIAMGYVAINEAKPGNQINLIIRGKQQPAEVCTLPFVKQNYKR